jgi:hypothetical protein
MRQCPHCKKRNCFNEVARHNAENYGGNSYKMICSKCHKPIVVYLERVVICRGIEKGNHKRDECDFSL